MSSGTDARWPRVVAEVVAWIVLVAIVFVSMIGIGLANHFSCGGTFGGYGESASARLDEACVDRRTWLLGIPIVVLAALVVIRLLLWRRSRTSG